MNSKTSSRSIRRINNIKSRPKASCCIRLCQKICVVTKDERVQHDIMDQNTIDDNLTMETLRFAEKPTSEETKKVDAQLDRLNCKSGHSSDRALTDRDGMVHHSGFVNVPHFCEVTHACLASPHSHEFERHQSTRPSFGVKSVWTTWIWTLLAHTMVGKSFGCGGGCVTDVV